LLLELRHCGHGGAGVDPPFHAGARSASLDFHMQDYDEQFRLTIPIEDAFAFSMGEFELGPNETCDAMRQLVGVLVIDTLQYGEHWRIAAEARAFLAERWPDCPAFRANNPN
jgi:hypothetical protein